VKLSIVVATLFPELLPGAVDTAHAAAGDLTHEVVVVSPFDPARSDVRWVPDLAPRGSIAAANLGMRESRGEFVAAISDDVRPTAGAFASAVARLAALPGGMIGFPRVVGGQGFIGTAFGHFYPYFFLLARATLERVGFFDEGYRKHYADPDLAMKIWTSGGRCEFLRDTAVVDVPSRGGAGEAPDKALGSRAADFARFFGKWSGHFDPAWGVEESDINLDIALDFVQMAGGEVSTCAVRDPAKVFDLRALSALSLVGLNHRTKIGLGRAAQALDYLRWLVALDPSPVNIVVGNGTRVLLAKPF
jgi:hypothetical protein